MADLVPVKFEDGTTIYVEGAESAPLPGAPPIQEAGAGDAAKKALETAQEISSSIRSFCGCIVGSLHELEGVAHPTKATIEFGINISIEGNVYLVKGTGEASIKITAEWQLPKGGGRNE